MSDGLSIEIPDSEIEKLSAALNRKLEYTKETQAEATNKAAQNLAFHALAQTEKASRHTIVTELGRRPIGVEVFFSKNGKRRLKKTKILLSDDSFAARIINARLRDSGQPLLFGDKMQSAVRALINARTRAIGFVKSGWIPAIIELAAKTKTRLRIDLRDAKQFGAAKGYAVPATESLTPEAMVVNTATNNSPQAAADAQRGLDRAVPIVTADLEVYINRKMQEAMDK